MQQIVEGKRTCYQGKPLESLSSLKEENVQYDLEEKCQQVKNAIRKHEMEVQEQVRQHLVKQRNELFRDVDKFMETKRLEIQQVYRKDVFERNRFNTVETHGKGNIESKYGNCNGRKELSVDIDYIRDDLDGSLKLNSLCLGKLDHNFNSTRINSTETSAPAVTNDPGDLSKADVSADEDEDSKEYINVKDATKHSGNISRHRPNPRPRRRCASADGQVTTSKPKICPRPDNYENLWDAGKNSPLRPPDRAPFNNHAKRNTHDRKGLPCEPCVQSQRRADWEYVEIKVRHSSLN